MNHDLPSDVGVDPELFGVFGLFGVSGSDLVLSPTSLPSAFSIVVLSWNYKVTDVNSNTSVYLDSNI